MLRRRAQHRQHGSSSSRRSSSSSSSRQSSRRSCPPGSSSMTVGAAAPGGQLPCALSMATKLSSCSPICQQMRSSLQTMQPCLVRRQQPQPCGMTQGPKQGLSCCVRCAAALRTASCCCRSNNQRRCCRRSQHSLIGETRRLQPLCPGSVSTRPTRRLGVHGPAPNLRTTPLPVSLQMRSLAAR